MAGAPKCFPHDSSLRVVSWRGKLGLLAGVTTVVDQHHGVIESLGSRFMLYRVQIDDRREQARRAIGHRRSTSAMRTELRDAVNGFFAGLALDEHERLTTADRERLVELADFVTLARSPIERDRHTRDIDFVPDPEAPARFGGMLAVLLEALRLIGLDNQLAWTLVHKAALDSMPAQRRRVLEHLHTEPKSTTKSLAMLLGLPTSSTRRALEELAAHGLVLRESDGKTDYWTLLASFPQCR
jgi:hypothetical protein